MGTNFFRDFHKKSGLLFIHVPKVAGTSIEQAIYDTDRWLSGHCYALDYYKENQEEFKCLFSFGFVRNPYDRLVSAFLYLKKGGGCTEDFLFSQEVLANIDFKEFVFELQKNPKLLSWIHFQPQYLFLCDEEKKILVNYVGKYENIQEDFSTICQKNNIEKTLPNANTNPHINYTFYYDEETAKIVAEIYNDDFRIFGYTKDIELETSPSLEDRLKEEERKNFSLMLSNEYLKITQSFEWIVGKIICDKTNGTIESLKKFLKIFSCFYFKILPHYQITNKCKQIESLLHKEHFKKGEQCLNILRGGRKGWLKLFFILVVKKQTI